MIPKSIAVSLFAAMVGHASVQAQDKYPSRPIQMIVPIGSGSATDIIARMHADKIGQRLGQSIIVQNRPGAGSTIASQAVAQSAPDGYTILMVNSAHSINPALYPSLPYDTLRDFVGIAMVGLSPNLVVVHPSLAVKNLAEFVALAKQKPGTINYASAGVGTATHLAGAYFASKTGIEIVHVPYKGTADLIADMVTGRIQATFVPPAFLLSQIREGKVLALATTHTEPMRSPFALPTVREAAGIADYENVTWYGFVAPAKTPMPVLETLARALEVSAADPSVLERYAAQGILSRTMLLREFDAFIKTDMERIGPLIKSIGAKAQ